MDVLYAEDLGECTCGHPECKNKGGGHLYLQAACHPQAGLTVMHHEGLIVVGCMECKRTVIQVALASKPQNVVDPQAPRVQDAGG